MRFAAVLIVAGFVAAYIGWNSLPGPAFGVTNQIRGVSIPFAITALPFILPLSYVVRLAMIAER